MSEHFSKFLLLLACTLLFPSVWAAQPPVLHNGGAAYFWLEKGTFELEIFKREWGRPISRFDTERLFRADLLSPSRELLAHFTLEGDASIKSRKAEWGALSSKKMRVQIEEEGVYLLLVSVKRDSYFNSIRWGFRTNATRYLIDAGAGHYDAPRSERISFLVQKSPVGITFSPFTAPFTVSAQKLAGGRGEVTVLAAKGDTVLAALPVKGETAAGVVMEKTGSLLTLQLPYRSGQVQIAGVTEREQGAGGWLPLWTPQADSWFNLEAVRWLLSPRYQLVEASAAGDVAAVFTLNNTTDAPLLVEFEVLAKDGTVLQKAEQIQLAKGERRQLDVGFVAPSGQAEAHLVARVAGCPPALAALRWQQPAAATDADPLQQTQIELPFQVPILRHNREAFGEHGTSKSHQQTYFDASGAPWFLDEQGLWTLRDGQWQCVVAANKDGLGASVSNRIGTDALGRVYALFQRSGNHTLVAVDAKDLSIDELILPGRLRGKVLLEAPVSTQLSEKPPVILVYERTGTAPRDPKVRWGVDHRLRAYVTDWKEGALVLADDYTLSEHCIGVSDHSGLTSPVAQQGDSVFFVYGETSAPDSGDTGVPTFVRVLDRKSNALGEPLLVGHAPPANDVHNVPSLLVDSEGGIHVIVGAHNKSFTYSYSKAGDGDRTWTPIREVASDYDQTYVGAVMDAQDTIHLVSRIWRRGPNFPNDEFDTALIYQRKPRDGGWSRPQLLVLPPMPHYSVYYHRLTIAPDGTLHLAWTHWPTWSSYRNELESLAPAGSTFDYLHWRSPSGGESWEWVRDWETKTPPAAPQQSD